jgi:hypothetical protein
MDATYEPRTGKTHLNGDGEELAKFILTCENHYRNNQNDSGNGNGHGEKTSTPSIRTSILRELNSHTVHVYDREAVNRDAMDVSRDSGKNSPEVLTQPSGFLGHRFDSDGVPYLLEYEIQVLLASTTDTYRTTYHVLRYFDSPDGLTASGILPYLKDEEFLHRMGLVPTERPFGSEAVTQRLSQLVHKGLAYRTGIGHYRAVTAYEDQEELPHGN